MQRSQPKANQRKASLKVYVHPILWRGDIKKGSTATPKKIRALMEMPPPQTKKELQACLGVITYLEKFSPSMATVCEPLQKLTPSTVEWTWNAAHQAINDSIKSLIKADACMKFYDKSKSLHLETDASRLGLETTLL